MISDDELATRMHFFDRCGKPWCATCAEWLKQSLEGLKALNGPHEDYDLRSALIEDYVKRREAALSDQSCKQDDGKVRWSLLFTHCQEALKEVVAVRAYGESKYGTSESWKEVAPPRYLEAATRHVLKLHLGEEINSEDGGMRHAAQAITDLLFYLENRLREERQ